MQARADGRVAGRALRHKEHRILCAHRVGVVDLAEELAGIGKLRLEFGERIFAHGVATGADAGTDGGDQILRPGAELEPHAAHTALDDALDGAAPARTTLLE